MLLFLFNRLESLWGFVTHLRLLSKQVDSLWLDQPSNDFQESQEPHLLNLHTEQLNNVTQLIIYGQYMIGIENCCRYL